MFFFIQFLLGNMIERQDSNSKINVFVTMEDHVAQVVPTCKKYDNIPTFVLDDLRACDSTDNKLTNTIESIPDGLVTDAVSTTTCGSVFNSGAMFSLSESEPTFVQSTTVTPITGMDSQNIMDITLTSDPRLNDMAKQALIHGNMTPLIKEELKCSIQTKRLKEGKQEMKVEFTDPPPDELTPEEVERVKKRKVQNRLAARRFRDKQKNRAEYLHKKCQEMEAEQTSLRHELNQVKKERDQLKQAWTNHMASCPWSDSLVPMFINQSQSNDT
ncbi:Cyclic AMP-dependent transcription factor ATF-3 [Mactra antiquata]